MKQLEKIKLPGSVAGLSKEATKHGRAVMKQLDKFQWNKRQKPIGLDDPVNTQGTADTQGTNTHSTTHEFKKNKRQVEQELAEQQMQLEELEELEDELQRTEYQEIQLEMNMQALKT